MTFAHCPRCRTSTSLEGATAQTEILCVSCGDPCEIVTAAAALPQIHEAEGALAGVTNRPVLPLTCAAGCSIFAALSLTGLCLIWVLAKFLMFLASRLPNTGPVVP